MRFLIWLIVLFALAAGLAMIAGVNDGYVLLVFPPWRAQLSLNLLLVLLVVGFSFGHLFLRLVGRTFALPSRVVQWRQRRRGRKAGLALREALGALFEGRFAQALKLAASAFSAGESPALAALLAARAAHAMQDEERYRLWMGHAQAQGETLQLARLMTQTELAIEDRRFDEAARHLQALEETGQRHVAVLRMAVSVHLAQRRWEELLHQVRQLRKHKALSEEQAAPLLRRAHVERLQELDASARAAYWKTIPADEMQDHRFIEQAVPLLAAAGQGALARRMVERLLDRKWDTGLARIYARCGEGEGGDAIACLSHAEAWLKQQPEDAGLLYALGRLCIGARLWGKAQTYLEAALSRQPTVEGHLALAGLMEQLERTESAQQHYRAAAQQVVGDMA
jgi:HemY protein